MNKDLEYFKLFLDDPGAYKVKEFYEWIREWAEYIEEHKHEFNYLEDEEWSEVKDRVLEVLTVQEDRREEFWEIQEWIEEANETDDYDEKAASRKAWLEFMKRNKWSFDFTDEQIDEYEKAYGEMVIANLDIQASEERLKRSRGRYERELEKLDEALTEHYLRTGRRLVLTSLTRRKGN